MTIEVGDWHRLVVGLIPEDADGPEELEFDVIHLNSCPTESIYDGMVLAHRCSMGWEIENNGFDSFDITEPGTYRARVHYDPGDGWMNEPDVEVEVKKVDED